MWPRSYFTRSYFPLFYWSGGSSASPPGVGDTQESRETQEVLEYAYIPATATSRESQEIVERGWKVPGYARESQEILEYAFVPVPGGFSWAGVRRARHAISAPGSIAV